MTTQNRVVPLFSPVAKIDPPTIVIESSDEEVVSDVVSDSIDDLSQIVSDCHLHQPTSTSTPSKAELPKPREARRDTQFMHSEVKVFTPAPQI